MKELGKGKGGKGGEGGEHDMIEFFLPLAFYCISTFN